MIEMNGVGKSTNELPNQLLPNDDWIVKTSDSDSIFSYSVYNVSTMYGGALEVTRWFAWVKCTFSLISFTSRDGLTFYHIIY